MKPSTKILLAIATFSIFFGLVAFVFVMSLNGWDFTKLSTSNIKVTTYEYEDYVTNINMTLDTEDVTLLPSDDGKIKIICEESDKAKFSVKLIDGELKIEMLDANKWFNRIFDFASHKITVHLPNSASPSLNIKSDTSDVQISSALRFNSIDISLSTGDVLCGASVTGHAKIKASTGNITLVNMSADSIDIRVSTGDVTLGTVRAGDVSINLSTGKSRLTDVYLKNLTTSASTGDISLTKVFADGIFSISRTTGDVNFNSCDAPGIYVETDTGNVTGSIATPKIFLADTSTGKIEVPYGTSGGICEIKTSTGDIKIWIAP